VDVDDRKRMIAGRIDDLVAEKALAVMDDPDLRDEVTGLVEWPVPHLGRIPDEHMDLLPAGDAGVDAREPALFRAAHGGPEWRCGSFAFRQIEADDHGAAIIAGNERVLRTRFADGWHFWDLDRRIRLETRILALHAVTFQAKLGTRGARVGAGVNP
jgi:glycyl-tRNA synthetase beta chain